MVHAVRQIAMALVCVVTIFLGHASAQRPDVAPDNVGAAWRSRAEAAAKRLATPGLDKCDMAVERAFQHPVETTSGQLRSFGLHVTIDGQTLVASYSYVGQRLNAFVLVELPAEWLAVQETGSKNLNILVQNANCTFDLCTNDPFITESCAEPRAR